MKINYYGKNGRICFSYKEVVSIESRVHPKLYRVYEFSDEIPKKIQTQGEQAIRNYAEEKVKTEIEKQRDSASKQDKFAKNPNFPISVECGNETLIGRIISAHNDILQVRLEKPCTGESNVVFGFGSAMSNRHIFDKSGKFSKEAIASAQELLIRIYRENEHFKKYGNIKNLIARLNS